MVGVAGRYQQIHPRLTEPAAAAWERLSIDERITVTALCEALGLAFAGGWTPPPEILDAARQVDTDRRSRR